MPGKFPDDIAEILYQSSLDGGHDEESGSVQDRGVWSAIFRGIEVRPGDDPEIQDGFPGGYILEEDDQGFVSYSEFDDDEKLDAAWLWIEEQNAAWEAGGGEEEF